MGCCFSETKDSFVAHLLVLDSLDASADLPYGLVDAGQALLQGILTKLVQLLPVCYCIAQLLCALLYVLQPPGHITTVE